MGRRSRKRAPAGDRPEAVEPPTGDPAGAGRAEPPAPARPHRRRARLDEAPPAPWHPFPLVELAILAGIVMLVWGYLSEGDRREVLFIGGLALVCLASLELVIREHFGGYRSHSSLLALFCGFAVGAPVFALGASRAATALVAVAAAVGSFLVLRTVFARRTGGMRWRA